MLITRHSAHGGLQIYIPTARTHKFETVREKANNFERNQFRENNRNCTEAGRSILDVYNSEDFGVETKSDNSPLTKADKASDEIIEKRLNEFYPEIPILSEEGKNVSFG